MSSDSSAPLILQTNLPTLQLISRGKVRDIYALASNPDALLFVATDRISAYDVILKNGIPTKGILLTKISSFWFDKLAHIVPNHVITTSFDEMPQAELGPYREQLKDRTMLVKRAKVVKIEAIVRGYLAGSAWGEYKKLGTVHGIPMPPGMVESQKFPEPLFTPSTKADQGEHDENLHPDAAKKLLGDALYDQVSSTALALYTAASQYAESRGLILADTKFEFGQLPDGPLILIDEVLTPDSSRYWPKNGYQPGKSQPSFDKQYVRDWLVENGFKKGLESGPVGHEGEGWEIEKSVVEGTKERYKEAVERLMG
ncbi:hypothetical protein M422DRAFT_220263 [Sphaerobolus stellatus SS14]|nr:hypothetical protein M422DRAFT_220263 [Sphaerobolus stellatus SS14]